MIEKGERQVTLTKNLMTFCFPVRALLKIAILVAEQYNDENNIGLSKTKSFGSTRSTISPHRIVFWDLTEPS